MIRVLYISDRASLGGGQQSMLAVMRALHTQGAQYTVIVPSPGDLEGECRALGVPVFVKACAPFRGGRWRDIKDTRRFISTVIERQGIAVLHTEIPRSALYAMTMRRPLVFHARVGTRAWFFDRLLERWANRIVCVSADVARRFFMAPEGRRPVIPNGVDLALFCPSAEKRAVVRQRWGVGDRPLIGMAAEIIPGKGIFDLLDIAAIVLRACPEARFVFAGSGSAALTNRFRQAIVAAGLHERVVVLGQVKQMDEFHAALDAFVLPSRLREGLPRTLIEAAACGVPAVAYDRGGCREVIQAGETGLLVPVGDVEQFAQRVRVLIEDRSLRRRMGARARERAETAFDISRCAGTILRVYEELVVER